jgi:radical SAM family uncharacterized protein/radical SAM-linked protein
MGVEKISPTDGKPLKQLLSLVSKPARYLGNEVNSIRKTPGRGRLKFCFAFPDAYEVGMSHLGLQILYHLLNEREEISCERVFAPWVDMENVLREKKVPLSSLESATPLGEFDILGFSLQYELCFTNVLNMLDLAHIPFLSKDRDDRFPLILGGGPTAFNPAPVADFFDALVIGDGEEVILEICDLALRAKEEKGGKDALLTSLSRLEGVYVPSLHSDRKRIRKRIVSDLNTAFYPTHPIVPYMKVVHDRLSMEIARGCKRGCRFCAAGFIHRPYRERNPELVQETIKTSLGQTGYEEFSLLSLSAGDYSCIGSLLSTLMDQFESKKVAVSFPSLRIESVVGYLAEQVKRVRKTGFTIAPEAGTDRLRRVINKELDERVLFQGVEDLFSMGWKNVKLYFMMGLPTEKDEDLQGIIALSKKLRVQGEKQKVHPNISISVSTFVPKPHTPFQWEPQIPLEQMRDRLDVLKQEVKQNRLHFKWQDPHLSHLEGIFSTGDRILSKVLIEAHRLGCRFDGWSDQFRYPLWREAFERAGVGMDLATRKKGLEDRLPWSFVDTGVEPSFLWEEYQKGLGGEGSPPCKGERCRRCGVCDGEVVTLRESRGMREEPLVPSGRQEWRARSEVRRQKVKKKIRMKFTKTGELRLVSHLELVLLFTRASKRADLPLSYSEGFHPMPRIIFAKALSVGVESLSEIVDMELEGRITALDVKEKLNQALPDGIRILEAEEVPFSSSPGHLVRRSVFWIRLKDLLPKEEATAKFEKALGEDVLFIDQERKGKQRRVDVRPMIGSMEVKHHPPWAGNSENPPGERIVRGNNGWGVQLVLLDVMEKTAKPLEIVGAILGLGKDSVSQCDVVKIE